MDGRREEKVELKEKELVSSSTLNRLREATQIPWQELKPNRYRVEVSTIPDAITMLEDLLKRTKGLNIDLALDFGITPDEIRKIEERSDQHDYKRNTQLDYQSSIRLVDELLYYEPDFELIDNLLSGITKLNLARCDINDGIIENLIKILPNTKVKELDLSNNPIGVEGAKILAESLKNNTTLVVFKGTNNEWGGPDGQRAMRDVLYYNQNLCVYSLDNSPFYSSGLIRPLIKKNQEISKKRQKYLDEEFPKEMERFSPSVQKIIESYLTPHGLKVNEELMYMKQFISLKWEQHASYSDSYYVMCANQQEANKIVNAIRNILSSPSAQEENKLNKYWNEKEMRELLKKLIPTIKESIDGVYRIFITIPPDEIFALAGFKEYFYQTVFDRLAKVDQNQVLEYKERKENISQIDPIIEILKPLLSFKKSWGQMIQEYFNQKKSEHLYNELLAKLTTIEASSSNEVQATLFAEIIDRISNEKKSLTPCLYLNALVETERGIYFRYECLTLTPNPEVHITISRP